MTGKAEFRNRAKVNSLYNDNMEGNENSSYKNSSNFKVKKEQKGFALFEPPVTSQNSRKTIPSKLNKTSKINRKPGTAVNKKEDRTGMNAKGGFGMVGNDQNVYSGHNYTVSINFNRPQQSKGKRPIKKSKESSKKKNGWMNNNNIFRGTPGFDAQNHQKVQKQLYNIYDYDIETDKAAGYIDIESSTRKRPSKTAINKKRKVYDNQNV